VADDDLGNPTPTRIMMRQPMSPFHILAAARFSKLSAVVEREHRDHTWVEVNRSGAFFEHRGYVMGAIFMAVAFLEATINELFRDAVDAYTVAEHVYPPPIRRVPEPVRKLLAKRWRESVEREDTLSKYQIALKSAGKAPLDPGRQPYQDAKLLIGLRNRLVHYKPEFVVAGEHIAERQLRGKFAENPFIEADTDNPFYPDRCLSHGCAKWAAESSINFADEFHTRMRTIRAYDPHRPFETE
jgi:hypothetical protein